jgi:hypothetical protein
VRAFSIRCEGRAALVSFRGRSRSRGQYIVMGGAGREQSPQSTARLSASASAPATVEEDLEPSSLGLVAEISALLRSPPLPPRATLERVKALLTAARAVAAVDSLDREALHGPAADTVVARGPAGTRPLSHESAATIGVVCGSIGPARDIRADTIRAAQLAREKEPSSMGSRLALGKAPPTNDLNVKIFNEKRGGMLKVPALAVSPLGSCASLGRARRLRAATAYGARASHLQSRRVHRLCPS